MRSLEDYIAEMERRNNGAIMENNNGSSGSGGDDNCAANGGAAPIAAAMPRNAAASFGISTEDVWTHLKDKENDLLLAAELGKALLEKNEKLEKQNEELREEYSRKLEEVEQDRHLLKRKFANRESEFEARIAELQNDVGELQERLHSKDQTIKQWEKDKSLLLAELSAQNQRLTVQLKESLDAEKRLENEIETLREQCTMGKSNLQEHLSSFEGLRVEVDVLAQKKSQLERRLQQMQEENAHLTGALDESNEKGLFLERQYKDLEIRYQQLVKEGPECIQMDDRHSKMDISEPTLSQEYMSVYRQLRTLCQQLKSSQTDDDDSGLHSDCSSGTNGDDKQQISAGLLSEVAQELVTLVLDSDVVRILERLEQSRRDVQDRDAELQRRSDTIIELTRKLSVCEVELQAALEERDRARHDAAHTSLNQDEIVSKAREVRDQAVSRKNKAEVELAKIRVELLQANSQLMEAIQQKVELSQQLEQWQMDMQELLDEQLRNKLSSHEIKMRSEVSEQPTATHMAATRRRLLQFFQR